MEKNLIPGIYNYCNSWCERCALAHRCRVRADELGSDIENPGDILPDLSFAETEFDEDEEVIEFVPDFDEQAADTEAQVNLRKEQYKQLIMDNTAIAEANVAGALIDEVVRKIKVKLQSQPPTSVEGLTYHQQQKVEGREHRIQNLLDILSWYRFMLQVKTMRAVNGKQHFVEGDEDPIQNDFNGSAKVIMLGAEHCIKAAEGLLHLFPEIEDDLLPLLACLQRYQTSMYHQFPAAMQFIRPGFDTLNIKEDFGA